MKKVLFLLCLCSLTAFGQKHIASKMFTLTGKIVDRDTGRITVVYVNNAAKSIIDTLELDKGLFSCSGYIEGISHVMIFDRGFGNANTMDFFIEPGHTDVTLAADNFRHHTIVGSVAQREFEILTAQPDRSAAYLNYVSTHPYSYLSAGLMYNAIFGLPVDTGLLLFHKLDFRVRYSSLGVQVSSRLKRAFEAAKSYKPNGVASVGTLAPIFAQKDVNGKNLSLADYRGKKYVLLDFWASWCGPCRNLPPSYKKIYATYGKDLEIISISLDEDNKAWKDAIATDGLGVWRNIVVNERKSKILKDYNIQTIPVAVLIDKEGKIIFRSMRVGEIMLLSNGMDGFIK